MKARLTGYGLRATTIEPVLKQLESHRMVTLGERHAVTLEVSRQAEVEYPVEGCTMTSLARERPNLGSRALPHAHITPYPTSDR